MRCKHWSGVAIVLLVLLVLLGGCGGERWVDVTPVLNVRADWPFVTSVQGLPVFVVQLPDQQYRVLLNHDPSNAERSIAWSPHEQLFVAGHDGTTFDRFGRWRFGPAPRSLDWLPTRVQAGVVQVRLDQVVRADPAAVGAQP